MSEYNKQGVAMFLCAMGISSCHSGSENRSSENIVTNSLQIITPKTIYSKPDSNGSGYVLVSNPSNTTVRNLHYSLTSIVGGADGTSIESASAIQCADIESNSQCAVKLIVPVGAVAGSVSFSVSNNSSSLSGRLSKLAKTTSLVPTIGIEQAAYNNQVGADGVTLSYYHTVINGTPYILVSGLVASANAGNFNKIVLVDDIGVELPNQQMLSDVSGSQGLTFSLLLSASYGNNIIQPVRVQTQQMTDGEAMLVSIATSVSTLAIRENVGIAEMLPSAVYLTADNPEQTITIANIGDTAMQLQELTSSNSNVEVNFSPISLASGATTTATLKLKDKTVAPTTGGITLTYNNGQSEVTISGSVDQNVIPAPTPTPTPTPIPPGQLNIAITNISGNTPTSIMGIVPVAFTATLSGGSISDTSTLSAILANSVTGTIVSNPSPCALTIGGTTSCTFTITPWYTGFDNSIVGLTNYDPFTPAGTVISLSSTGGVSISGVTSNQISYNVTTPYVYVQAVAPGNSATVGTGVTYGTGGSINPRFINGSQNGGGDCTGSKKDNLTGVEWLTNANEVCSTLNCTWSDTAAAGSAQKAAADFNTAGGKCGYTDWRLPTEKELLSLYNYSAASDDFAGWLATQGFTGSNSGAPSGSGYWSVTNASNNYAFRVYLSGGYNPAAAKSSTMSAWLVRSDVTKVAKDKPGNTLAGGVGKEWPTTRFIADSTGDCMVDNLTGLMYPKNINILGIGTWDSSAPAGSAQYKVAQMNINSNATGYQLCGYTDWRLASLNEAFSLINYGAVNFNSAMWLGTQGFTGSNGGGTPASNTYWTSTTGNTGAWVLTINLGTPRQFIVPGSTTTNILVVRGGQ